MRRCKKGIGTFILATLYNACNFFRACLLAEKRFFLFFFWTTRNGDRWNNLDFRKRKLRTGSSSEELEPRDDSWLSGILSVINRKKVSGSKRETLIEGRTRRSVLTGVTWNLWSREIFLIWIYSFFFYINIYVKLMKLLRKLQLPRDTKWFAAVTSVTSTKMDLLYEQIDNYLHN